MSQIKIIYDKKACIGAGECESSGKDLWHVGPDGKAVLKDAVLKDGKYELILDEIDFKKQDLIAKSCPIGAIKVVRI